MRLFRFARLGVRQPPRSTARGRLLHAALGFRARFGATTGRAGARCSSQASSSTRWSSRRKRVGAEPVGSGPAGSGRYVWSAAQWGTRGARLTVTDESPV